MTTVQGMLKFPLPNKEVDTCDRLALERLWSTYETNTGLLSAGNGNGARVLRHARMTRRLRQRRHCCKNCEFVRRVKREHSSYRAEAMGRYLGEQVGESPWTPLLILGVSSKDEEGDQASQKSTITDWDRPLTDRLPANVVQRLSQMKLGTEAVGASHSAAGFVATSQVQHVGNSSSGMPEADDHRGEKAAQSSSFVDCELEYTEGGWVKIGVW